MFKSGDLNVNICLVVEIIVINSFLYKNVFIWNKMLLGFFRDIILVLCEYIDGSFFGSFDNLID